MKKLIIILLIAYIAPHLSIAQNTAVNPITVRVMDENQKLIENATVEIYSNSEKKILKSLITDRDGLAKVELSANGSYYIIAKAINFEQNVPVKFEIPTLTRFINILITTKSAQIKEVTVTAKKQLIQRAQGKTIINVDASITNVGTSVLDVLEKSPGVSVDRNGAIALQGKPRVLVLIDDKPTYLSGEDLSNLLSSMNSSQVNQIELITSPSAKYDASGNAGIINIKTKKNIQQGFNGNLSSTGGSGIYYKNNNALNLNLRKGKFNTFLNYSSGLNKTLSDIYAIRDYYTPNHQINATLDQTSKITSANTTNNLKLGTDFLLSENTQFGISASGLIGLRKGAGNSTADWLGTNGVIDSTIITNSDTRYKINNQAIQLYASHQLNSNQKISADFDVLNYKIDNKQNFYNQLIGGLATQTASMGTIPTSLKITALKTDYSLNIDPSKKFEAGLKSSSITTDNLADYTAFDGSNWSKDYNKSNHFLYNEYINSAYSTFDYKRGKLSAQVGIRYENTFYRGNQKGNILKPDSTFSKSYNDLFPSAFATYQLDSLNTLSFTAGRRIDRPAYQKLNPVVFIINKYTHTQGNPYFLPQHSWNFDITHSWNSTLITSLSYSNTKNYFSQLFFDKGDDILVYAEGNVGKVQNIGLSVAAQFDITRWWSVSGQSTFNHKKMVGYHGIDYSSNINQLHTNISQAFKLNKGLNAELSGFYTTKARNDLQEILTPTGQLTLGLSQSVLKGNGTFRFSARDIFYSLAMEGYTDFPNAYEYFINMRDSRVFTLGFNYLFGKKLKSIKRNSGSASDEIKRATS